MRIQTKIKEDSLISFLPILYYLGNFIKMYNGNIVINYIIMAGAGSFGLLTIWRHHVNELRAYHLFYFVYFLSIIVCSLVSHNTSLIDLSTSLFLIGITDLMLLHRWSEKLGAIAFYIMFFLLLYRILGPDLRVLSISSNNYISVLILLADAFYYIPFEWNGRSLGLKELLPASLSFVIAVIAAGRGGILSTGILLSGLVLMRIFQITASKRMHFFAIVAIVFSLIIIQTVDESFFSHFSHFGKFATEGANSSIRVQMWREYFFAITSSIKYLVFGYPLREIFIIARYNGNPHNSFIFLHAIGGIFSFLLFIMFFVRSVLKHIKNKHFIMLLLLIVLVTRGMTDKFIFGQYGMPVFVFLLLYPFCNFDTDHH